MSYLDLEDLRVFALADLLELLSVYILLECLGIELIGVIDHIGNQFSLINLELLYLKSI